MNTVRLIDDISVSRETFEKLETYSRLLEKWTKSINLISNGSIQNIWERHITDSAQLYSYAPSEWARWTDIGSGGGLPGLVVSILDSERRPVTLIESDQRKCLFLNAVRRELDLNVTVLNGRIENQDIEKADVLSARALAPLTELLRFSQKLLLSSGVCLFPKGKTYQEELDQAELEWVFDCKAHRSATQVDARILEVSRIKNREC